jgi:hypothetical protein
MAETGNSGKAIPGWGWLVVILISALIIGWGLLNFAIIKDPPRTWHFGALPDAPGQSIYSTQEPPSAATAPPQIPPLPEAKPREKSGGAP